MILQVLSPWKTRWWFQICFIFISTWGNDPIWRAYFSNGLKPPTRIRKIPILTSISQMGWNHKIAKTIPLSLKLLKSFIVIHSPASILPCRMYRMYQAVPFLGFPWDRPRTPSTSPGLEPKMWPWEYHDWRCRDWSLRGGVPSLKLTA